MKKYKRVTFYDAEECPKFEEKLTLRSENDMRNLVSFNPSSGKSENLQFDGLLMFEQIKHRRTDSWKILYIWSQKWQIIWWIFTQVIESNVR